MPTRAAVVVALGLGLAILVLCGTAGAQESSPEPPAGELTESPPTEPVPSPESLQTPSSPSPSDEPGSEPVPPAVPPLPDPVPPTDQPPSSPGPAPPDVTGLQPPPPSKPPVAPAASAWSVSLTSGYYRPRLGTLNRILRDTGVTIMQDPNFLLPRNENFTFEQRNLAVGGIGGGATYGVDAFYSTGGPHSFGLSFSSWRGETFAGDTISLFLRSNILPIDVPRSARYNLVLDRIFLEWRYHLFRNPGGRGVYVNIGLVGVSMAFLTMDALVNVVNPELSFASVSSDESFGWGYTTRFGVGGDYPLTSWLSVGGQANYVMATITRMRVTRHFLAGFPVQPLPEPFSIRPGTALPQLFFPPREGRTVTYANITTTNGVQEEAGKIQNLTLELSGLEALLKLTIHF